MNDFREFRNYKCVDDYSVKSSIKWLTAYIMRSGHFRVCSERNPSKTTEISLY